MFEGIEPCENDYNTLPKTEPNMSEDIEAFENDGVISVKPKSDGEAEYDHPKGMNKIGQSHN